VDYERDRVSRPNVNMAAPLAIYLLEDQDAALLHKLKPLMLKDPDGFAWDQEAGVAVNQYMYRTLPTSDEKHREFVTDLYTTGMLSFSEKTPRCLITPLFVEKKGNSSIRCVWDCRSLNAPFRGPNKCAMPSGVHWTTIELPKHDTLHNSQCDVTDCFTMFVFPRTR
jgi:hypothetical protein